MVFERFGVRGVRGGVVFKCVKVGECKVFWLGRVVFVWFLERWVLVDSFLGKGRGGLVIGVMYGDVVVG